MEITTDALPWDSDDTAHWKAFLATKSGQRLIPKVVESVPELLGSGDINSILIRTGEVRGFQDSVRTLLLLAAPPKVQQDNSPEAYPSLTDDSKWEDGKKLTPVNEE